MTERLNETPDLLSRLRELARLQSEATPGEWKNGIPRSRLDVFTERGKVLCRYEAGLFTDADFTCEAHNFPFAELVAEIERLTSGRFTAAGLAVFANSPMRRVTTHSSAVWSEASNSAGT